jgi:hypothetical protein
VHQDKRISRVRNNRLKDFSWVGEGLIDAALTSGADLNEILLGVEKKDRTEGKLNPAALTGLTICRNADLREADPSPDWS